MGLVSPRQCARTSASFECLAGPLANAGPRASGPFTKRRAPSPPDREISDAGSKPQLRYKFFESGIIPQGIVNWLGLQKLQPITVLPVGVT
jgi:hypothetical protein